MGQQTNLEVVVVLINAKQTNKPNKNRWDGTTGTVPSRGVVINF